MFFVNIVSVTNKKTPVSVCCVCVYFFFFSGDGDVEVRVARMSILGRVIIYLARETCFALRSLVTRFYVFAHLTHHLSVYRNP